MPDTKTTPDIFSRIAAFFFFSLLFLIANPSYGSIGDTPLDWENVDGNGNDFDFYFSGSENAYTLTGTPIRDAEQAGDPTNGGSGVGDDTVDIASGKEGTIPPDSTANCNPGQGTEECGDKPSAYFYYLDDGVSGIAGDYLLLRMRVVADPSAQDGSFSSNHWNFLISTEEDTVDGNGNSIPDLGDYKEFWLDVDGGANSLRVIYENEPQQDLTTDPDKTAGLIYDEFVSCAQYDATDTITVNSQLEGKQNNVLCEGNTFTRVVPTGDMSGGLENYYVDVQIPVTSLAKANIDGAGIDDTTNYQLFYSTSNSATDPMQKDYVADCESDTASQYYCQFGDDAGTLDFGDAGYADASHRIPYLTSKVFLGTVQPDDDFETLTGTGIADGDDTDNIADEDGVSFHLPSGGGNSIIADVTITNSTGGAVTVCGWLDVTSAGTFADTDGQCNTTTDTNVTFTWNNMPTDAAYTTYARFRVTSGTMTTADSSGLFPDGEVEDYQVIFDFTSTLAAISNFRVEMVLAGDLMNGLTGAADSYPVSDKDEKKRLQALRKSFAGLGQNSEVGVIRWETLSESGTAGFFIEQLDELSGEWKRLNKKMLPGLVTSPQGGEYLFIEQNALRGDTKTYRLVEMEVSGTLRHYGPWQITVGDAYTTGTDEKFSATSVAGKGKRDGKAVVSGKKKHFGKWHSLKDGFASRPKKIDPGQYEGGPPDIKTQSVSQVEAFSLQGIVEQVRMRTNKEGMYGLGLQELSSVTGMAPDKLGLELQKGKWTLSSGGNKIPYYFDRNAGFLYFAGEKYRTIETVENVYRLKRGQSAEKNIELVTGPGPQPNLPGQFHDSLAFEKENWLLTWVHNEEDSDYGYWDYVYAPYVPSATLTVELPDPAPQSYKTGLLKITLRGATSSHHAEVLLNGHSLGTVEWYGHTEKILAVPFNQEILNGTGNPGNVSTGVTVRGEVINGEPYSMFFVDAIEIEYDRMMYALEDNLWLHNVDGQIATVAGFSTPDVMVMESPTSESARLREDITVSKLAEGSWQVSFAANGVDYLVSGNVTAASPEVMQPDNLLDPANSADYLIIAPRVLAQSAGELAAYREHAFSSVRIVWLQDIYDVFNAGREYSGSIEDFLDFAYTNWSQPPRYVVLLGRGTLDHPDRLGYGESLIPLRMAATPWGLAFSDNRYADVNGDKLPEYAIGRIAASSNEEVLGYLAKLKIYEEPENDNWGRYAAIVADNPDKGGDFHANSDDVSDMFTNYGFTVDPLYHPDDSVREFLLNGWANGDYSYINYYGHGNPVSLGDRSESFLTTSDVAGLQNSPRLPVFAALTCTVGDSSAPGLLSLGDILTLQPDGGAIAGFVPTGLSIDYDAHLLNMFYVDALAGIGESVGEAACTARLHSYDYGIHPFMLDIYAVSGDPAVKLK